MNVRSPSDLGAVAEGATIAVGGRVRHVGGRGASRSPVLHDAFGSVELDLTEAQADEDDLLTVTGTLVRKPPGRAIIGCVIVARRPRGAGATGEDVQRFLDGGGGRRLEVRAQVTTSVRQFFVERTFLEVDTPCLVPSPGLDLHLGAFAVEAPGSAPYLSTSPEYQMKRLLVGGIPRCFQLARSFRRDESGRHHNAEFTLLEWYRAFASVGEVMQDTEELLCHVADCVPSAQRSLVLELPFVRLTVEQAFRDHAGVPEAAMLELARADTDTFFRLLVERIEPALAATGRPVFLHRYPRDMASLARLCPDDDRYAERFELYAGGLELCNGFGELTDATEQRARFERDQADRRREGLPVHPIDERFLDALATGMPDAAGNALGFDRLLMLVTGARSIDDVIAFPMSRL